MAFFNYATMQMAAKIVYYGPGLCGKTTNLQYIYNKTSPKSRGEMVSLETESDRTLFFDLLPLEVGVIAGFRTRFQLYTVPGQVFYGKTRRMVLKGVDGVVFVADSQIPVREANIESLRDLEKNLQEMGINLKDIPMVFQYNKRDLSNLLPIEQLEADLNPLHRPSFEASAVNGTGVFETLKGISRLTLQSLKAKLVRPSEAPVAQPREIPPAVPAPKTAAPPPAPPAPAGPARAASAPSAAPVPEVEFATLKTRTSDTELARTAPKVKTVATTSRRISVELDRIRDSLLTPILTATKPRVKDLTPALDELTKKGRTAPPADLVLDVPESVLGRPDEVSLLLDFGKDAEGKPVSVTAVAARELFQETPEGWVLRVKLVAKKA